MRILVIGGTRFVGRHLVATALARGHQVSVLHRGAGCEGAAGAEHLHADRDGDLGLLAGREWDATVDVCAYRPQQVAALAAALGERGGRHLLVSTVSVYADPDEPELDEDAPLWPPLGLDGDAPDVDGQTYGPLKVGCEHMARRLHPGRLLVVRPTYIIGPHDHTGRFPYYVARVARGGRVLCPGDRDTPFQYIDARDLAAFMVHLLEAGDEGTFHAVAPEPPFSFGDALEVVRATVGPEGTVLTWLPSEQLAAAGVDPSELPLWGGDDDPAFALAMDPDRAMAAGLVSRPLAQTVADTLDWLSGAQTPPGGAWLAAGREAELLSDAGWPG